MNMPLADYQVISCCNSRSFEYEDDDESYEYEHIDKIMQILDDDISFRLEGESGAYNSNDSDEYMHLRQIEKLLDEDGDSYEIANSQNIEHRGRYKLINRRIDSNRIRHKKLAFPNVQISMCKNVKLNEYGPTRSGAIIYTHYENKTYFCMGVDSLYGDLTDFAGGVKKNENVLEGGLRELEEESLGIFGKLTKNDIMDNLVFYSSNMMIMFIYLDLDIGKSRKDFSNRLKEMRAKEYYKLAEVSNIVWLEKSDFIDCINGKGEKRMYSRVKKILSKVTETILKL